MSDVRSTPLDRLDRLAPSRITLLWGALLVLVEFLSVLLYLRFASVEPLNYLFYAYPFVWINLGLWAILTIDPPSADAVQRRAASMVGTGYFLLLAYAGGLVAGGYGIVPNSTPGLALRLRTFPPGWGPVLVWNTSLVKFTLYPYKIIGYVALAYLIYVLVLEAAGASSAFGGVIGLFSCVSCSWPVLASVLTGVVGSGTALATAANSNVYGLSTLVFAITVLLLAWRPTLR